MQFFLLHKMVGSAYDTEYETTDTASFGEAPKCPACHVGHIGMRAWLPPFQVTLHIWGHAVGDIAFAGWDLLVSDRFRKVWQADGLHGVDVFDPVEIVRVKPQKFSRSLPQFFRVTPRWGSTTLDFKRSHIDRPRAPMCLVCGRGAINDTIRGLSVAEETWNGDDILRPLGMTNLIMASHRFKAMVGAYELKNANLTPIERYFWPPSRPDAN